MANVYAGRAGEDGARNQGWLLGHFMPKGDLLHTTDVEVKWGVHPSGERRGAWATDESRTALLVLIRGSFHIELRDRTIVLTDRATMSSGGPGRIIPGRPDRSRRSFSPSAGRHCRGGVSRPQSGNR